MISVIAISVSNLLQRVLMKDEKSDPVAYTVVFLVFLTVLTGVFAFYKGFIFPPISAYWFNFLLSTVLYAIGVVTWFKALQKIESSEAIIISSFGTVVTIGSSIAFLGEPFSLQQVGGMVLILVSIYLLNLTKGRFRLTVNHAWALIASVCYGLAATNDGYILGQGYDAVSYVPVMSILPAVLLVLYRPSVIKNVLVYLHPTFLNHMFLMTLFYSIQAIAYYVSFESGGYISQITPISKSSIILTVILAVIFLNERKNLFLKLLSTGFVVVGVLLIK